MSEHVALIQRGAQRAGYYAGPIDGKWNTDLSAALARIMIARGEPLAPHEPFNGLVTQPENSGARLATNSFDDGKRSVSNIKDKPT